MHNLNKILLRGSALILLSFMLVECEESDVARETREDSYAPPTIEIISGVTDGILGGVAGSSAGITMKVSSPWGLKSLLMNDVEVASMPVGQLTYEVSYSIPIPGDVEVGEPFDEVRFTVVDEDGQRSSTPYLAVQRNPLPDVFILSTLDGDELSRDNTLLPEQGSTSPRVKLGVTGDLGLDYSYVHLVFNDNKYNNYLDFGTAPEADPSEIGLAWIRKPSGVPIKAYNSLLIDLDSYIPEELVNDIIAGDRVIKMDVYYENPGVDEAGAFPAILNLSDKSLYNRATQAGILLEYTDTLTASNEWQTLIFDQTFPGNFADVNTTSDPEPGELDLVDLIIGRGYTNPDDAKYFIRNLRIEKATP